MQVCVETIVHHVFVDGMYNNNIRLAETNQIIILWNIVSLYFQCIESETTMETDISRKTAASN